MIHRYEDNERCQQEYSSKRRDFNKKEDFINEPPDILKGMFIKDIPNVDFDCEPQGDCWCKEIEYELPIPKRGICYSPREMKQLQIQISKKLGSYSHKTIQIDGC